MRRSAVALALAVGLACSPGPTPPVPLPDLTGVEDEVRRSVESTRALLLDDTTRPESWVRLGERYRSAGWNDEAAVCYREAQRLEPEHFRWAYLLGHALMESDPPAAAAAFARAIEIDGSYGPAHLHYAERLLQLGEDAAAREQFEITLRLEANNVHAAVGLAKLDLDDGRLEPARERLETAIGVDPRHGDARRSLAQVHLAQGDVEQAQIESDLAARLSYRRLIDDPRARFEVEPAGSIAHINAGKQLAQAGNPEGAADSFRRALLSNPDSSSAHYRLALVLIKLEKLDEAGIHLQEFRRIQPESVNYFNGLGELLLARDDPTGAAEAWLQSLRAHPDDSRIHFAMADLLARRDKARPAEHHFRESLRLDPWDPDVRFALGAWLDRQERQQEALVELREALRLAPHHARTQRYLGTMLSRLGEHAEGARHLQLAAELDPRDADTRVNLGLALTQLERCDDAISQFRQALEIRGDHAHAYNGLGRCLAASGRAAEAVEAYHEALRLRPGWPPAARRLAWIRATHGNGDLRDPAEAVRLAEQAAARPSAEALDTLAAAYAAAGRFDEAAQQARRALQRCRTEKRSQLAEAVGQRLALYEAHRPYREPSR